LLKPGYRNKKEKQDEMQKRFVTICFRHLKTDWLSFHRPALLNTAFVLASPDHGRMAITAVNVIAQKKGIMPGDVVADARAIYPGLQVINDKPGLAEGLLNSFTKFCIRYTPVVAIDPPDGLILEATGCPHLWGGEKQYITEIIMRFKGFGYDIRAGMADTIGTAWAVTRFEKKELIIETGQQKLALRYLPPAALRLEPGILQRLNKLGLRTLHSFMSMPRAALRRRFGQQLLTRLDQALGYEEEMIITAKGIQIALERLLEKLCHRLQQEQKGLRLACFTCYRLDGGIEKIEIGTNRASHHAGHLFKLFEIKIPGIEPALGIELFTLEASEIEELSPLQEKLWEDGCGLEDIQFSELMDRISGKIGAHTIHRYLPDQHYWPERSIRLASSIHEPMHTTWSYDKPRPIQLLSKPEPIEVTAPVPDYPPMLFRYKGKLHKIKKADGPERIEQEWWLQEGPHRDYYCVEDEEGHRYWLFRSGHYRKDKTYKWFLHGFFA
jgi:protein ImuB